MNEKITPFLWFDNNAYDAAKFYTSVFPNSKITSDSTYGESGAEVSGQKEGSSMVVELQINEQRISLLNGGPIFKINPSISFFLNFDPSKDKDAQSNLEKTWKKLSEGGTPLMPLQEYPFSKLYGWIEDKFGVSWQLILTNPKGEERPFIVPCLLFVKESYGKAEEARKFYRKVFKNSKDGLIAYYPENSEPNKEGTVMYSDFMLENTWFSAMDGPGTHDFAFNEGISFMIECYDQKEIDYFWENLSKGGRESQCGWLKDKFGVSWQVVPSQMSELIGGDDEERSERVMKAMFKMQKIDIQKLKDAYEGK